MDPKQQNDQQSLEQANDGVLEKAEALIWALLDDEIESADIKQLEEMLKDNETVRERYIQCVQMHTDLFQHFGAPQDSSQAELPKSPVLGSLGELRPGTDTLPLPE